MRKRSLVWGIMLSSLCFVGSLSAAEWGDLTARFVFDGAVPKAPAADIKGVDKEFCGRFHVIDESLLVNAENGGVANVVVLLNAGRDEGQPPVHESYAGAETAEVFLDNKQCRFAPHVVVLRTSQTLVVANSDSVAHNAKLTAWTNGGHNPLIPSGGRIKLKFPLAERNPVIVECNIHPWMKAWMYVKEHPYVGVSDKEGKVEIKNLPAGEWSFQARHEKSGYLRNLTINGTPTDRRGQFTIKIKPGKNELGEIKIPASLFKIK